MFRDNMLTEQIPERVYCLCKNVEKNGSISVEGLRNCMEPNYLGKQSPYFASYRRAAEELYLIAVTDNMVSLAVDRCVLKSMDTMRRYVNGVLENYQDGAFYAVTQEFFRMGTQILKGEQNLANRSGEFAEITGRKIDAVSMRAWRFWAEFLGFGVRSSDMFILPNAYVFLNDLIHQSDLQKGVRYSADEFISILRPMCNIVLDPADSSRTFNYGVSNGLRMLHDNKIIQMEHVLDNDDMWNLYPMLAHTIRGPVTNITVIK